jgi:membrane dipeptidase
MRVVAEWLAIERARSDRICIARDVGDLRSAKALGKTAVVLHFQGAEPIEDDVDLLNAFHACGLRVMQLTYNARNRIGDGCFEPSDIGLSRFGRRVISRMEELGIVVDLAHAGTRTCLEAAAACTRPFIVSHAKARALCDTPRNLTDDVIRAVAASGGVVGVCAAPFFLARGRTPILDDLVNHIDYMVELVGPKHVGLGLDFADEDEDDYVYFGYDDRYIPHPPWTWPAGIASHADARNIVKTLSDRGYSESDISGVIGENFLRVFAEVWGG